MNFKFIQRNVEEVDSYDIDRFSKRLGLDKNLVRLLFLRGFRDEKSIRSFLYPDYKAFHDPFLLHGMKEAAARIKQAIEKKEKVTIYGDYDCDGVCATAILCLYLSSQGVEVTPFIPSRLGEGYGLHIAALERIIDSAEPDLIITCDCGISGSKEVAHVLDLGVDIIVTDHHEVDEDFKPECVIVNPKQKSCNYPTKNLCGAAVALKVVEALGGEEERNKLLSLAAIATIADLVPLKEENRLIVQLGLKQENIKNPGLEALLRKHGIPNPSAGDIAYKVGPRINAAGRVGDAFRAFELLTTQDVLRIKELVDALEQDNDKRRVLSEVMFDEAVFEIKKEDLSENRAIVLLHPNWEKGVTGILAARIAGDYKRPTFIIVGEGDNCKGTCRGLGATSVYDLLSGAKEHLLSFGGHGQAAGFSLKQKNVDKFRKSINAQLADLPEHDFLPLIEYDADISEEEINLDFVRGLELLEPCGNANPRPIFRLKTDNLKVSLNKNNYRHTNILLESGLAILAFNHYPFNQFLIGTDEKELALEISLNTFQKKESIKAILRGVNPSKLYINDEMAKANFFKNISLKSQEIKKAIPYPKVQLKDLIDDNLYGTLYIAGCENTYQDFITSYSPKHLYHEFMFSTNPNNYTRISVSPVLDGSFDIANYTKIVFLDSPVGNGLVGHMMRQSTATIYIPENNNELLFYQGIDISREAFKLYYELFKANAATTAINVYAYYNKLKQIDESINPTALFAALLVFHELKLITLEKEQFGIQAVEGKKVNLDESKLYRELCEKLNG
ncbi:MAG: single-stranded-DNA-specific exonuclease RecJ [Firmicutes bacterium]|nr:single-stranded-DNA-specific exonuclease RecJ [Bacillota bacterium]